MATLRRGGMSSRRVASHILLAPSVLMHPVTTDHPQIQIRASTRPYGILFEADRPPSLVITLPCLSSRQLYTRQPHNSHTETYQGLRARRQVRSNSLCPPLLLLFDLPRPRGRDLALRLRHSCSCSRHNPTSQPYGHNRRDTSDPLQIVGVL